MNLKQRLSLYLSVAFAVLLGLSLAFIYYSFSNFRSQEFADRLEEEALSDVKLLIKTQNTDKQLLRTIDNNSVHKLYNEKTLIFDSSQHLIYSSVADALVRYNPKDLEKLKTNRTFFREANGQETFGLRYEPNQGNYYVIIAAEDIYGLSKLRYLAYTLLSIFSVGIFLVSGIVYLIVLRLVKPLDVLQQKVDEITVKELNTQLPDNQRNDEINLLSKSFNLMLKRIEVGYTAQRSFTAHASHELRTPISRLSLQLDNLMQQPHPEAIQNYLRSITSDVRLLAEIVQSLTTLTNIYSGKFEEQTKIERIDEIIFDAYTTVKKHFFDFQMGFKIVDNQGFIPELEVSANRSLLEIAFVNLFKNACLYSDNKKITVEIQQANALAPLQIVLTNTGAPLDKNQEDKLFDAFVRGTNAQNISGSGLGLRIVSRILEAHQASISYSSLPPNKHQFLIVFKVR